MIKIVETELIHRPVELVFAFATNPDKSKTWQTEKVNSEYVMPNGMMMKEVQGPGMTPLFTMDTLEFVPNEKVVTRLMGGGRGGKVTAHGVWLFEPVPEGTRVTFDWEVELHGLFKLFKFAVPSLVQKTLHADMVNLKQKMEA